MPKPMGRPSTYSPEIANEICVRLMSGETLRSICRDDDMPDETTVRCWIVDNRGNFSGQYARARDMGLDALADQLFDIADDGTNDWVDRVLRNGDVLRVIDNECVQRSRMRIDTRKWYLSKLAPKRYGDSVTLKGDRDNPIDIGLASALDALAARRGALPAIEDSQGVSLPVIDIETVQSKPE